ncbi:MAG TPA: hypothetical protein VKS01_08240, partial [Bryobacteraceae bacterium]|nr:hypothetical protein [Bryobacteraceae bacterium]
MKPLLILSAIAASAMLWVAGSTQAADTPTAKSEPVPLHKANYELAMQWTAAKVGRIVFDTAVTPHWLETGDKFWYSYET